MAEVWAEVAEVVAAAVAAADKSTLLRPTFIIKQLKREGGAPKEPRFLSNSFVEFVEFVEV